MTPADFERRLPPIMRLLSRVPASQLRSELMRDELSGQPGKIYEIALHRAWTRKDPVPAMDHAMLAHNLSMIQWGLDAWMDTSAPAALEWIESLPEDRASLVPHDAGFKGITLLLKNQDYASTASLLATENRPWLTQLHPQNDPQLLDATARASLRDSIAKLTDGERLRATARLDEFEQQFVLPQAR